MARSSGSTSLLRVMGSRRTTPRACVLARRVDGLGERLPSQFQVTPQLLAKNRSGHVWSLWAMVSRRDRVAHAARRRPGCSTTRSPAAPALASTARPVIPPPPPVRSRHANRPQHCSEAVLDNSDKCPCFEERYRRPLTPFHRLCYPLVRSLRASGEVTSRFRRRDRQERLSHGRLHWLG